MKTIKKLMDDARKSQEYAVEGLKLDITDQIIVRMKELGINRAELAKRIGSSRSWVTQFLQGGSNFTLASIVKIGAALEMKVSVGFGGKNQP